MLFRFVNEKGNRSIATYPDDSNFVVEEDSDGKCYIVVHRPPPTQPRVSRTQTLVGGLDKDTANRCIDEIYSRLQSKKADCDLTSIQHTPPIAK